MAGKAAPPLGGGGVLPKKGGRWGWAGIHALGPNSEEDCKAASCFSLRFLLRDEENAWVRRSGQVHGD